MAAKRKKKGNRYVKASADRKRRLRRAVAWSVISALFVAFVTGFALAAIFVHDYFTQTPRFAANVVNIKGGARLSNDEILAQAGVAPGMNILGVSLAVVQKRLTAHPWIAQARVSRRLPDEIDITVRERTPLAVLDLGEAFIMDAEGEIFKRWEPQDPVGLPTVTGLTFADISVGDDPPSRAFAAVRDFLEARKTADWAVSTAGCTISVDPDMGLSVLYSQPAVAVRLGFDDYARKLVRLSAVMESVRRDPGLSVSAINLVDPDRVVVQPVTTGDASRPLSGERTNHA